MDNRIVIPLLCAAALAYACGPWRHATVIAPASSHSSAHLKTDIATTFDVVPHGDKVDFLLSVTNNTSKTIELRFPTSQTHDFTVLDTQGRTVWRWSKGRMFTQAMQNKIVQSSDTLTIQDAWDANNAHGQYVAVATLNTGSHPIERRLAFTLP
jgi:hypothetical protein